MVKNSFLPVETPEDENVRVSVGVISDEGDAHGLTILHTAMYNMKLTQPSVIGTFPFAVKLLRNSLSDSGVEAVIVADLPVNKLDIESHLKAYEELAKSNIPIIHLDHHPTPSDIVQRLQQAGVKPIIVSGVQMTYYLLHVYDHADPLSIKIPSTDEIIEKLEAVDESTIHLAFDVSGSRQFDALLLLAGNRADMDAGLALLYRKHSHSGKNKELTGLLDRLATALDYLYRVHRHSLLSLPPHNAVRLAKAIAEKIEKGEIQYPPLQYAKKLLQLGERKDSVLIVDLNKVEKEVPRPWLNKSVAQLLASNTDLQYVLTYGIVDDFRTGTKQTNIAIYAPWYADTNLIKIAEKLTANKEEWKYYGHKTFITIAKQGEHPEEIKKIVEEVLNSLR